MRRVFTLTALVVLLLAGVARAQVPDVEVPITVTGDYVFAGPLSSDPTPDLAEIAVYGGTATVWFIDTSPTPDVQWPVGTEPPWWPGGTATGAVTYYTIGEGLPRPFNLRGSPADVLHVDMGTATLVVASYTKAR